MSRSCSHFRSLLLNNDNFCIIAQTLASQAGVKSFSFGEEEDEMSSGPKSSAQLVFLTITHSPTHIHGTL